MNDYVIYNSRIIDGTGAEAFSGYIVLSGNKISSIVKTPDNGYPAITAAHYIDAGGRYVTPGFIDIHRHGDFAIFRPGYGELELKQGITTVVNGNCGLSVAPVLSAYREEILAYLLPITGRADTADIGSIGAYLDAAEKVSIPINTGMLVGSGTVRAAIAGYGTRSMTRELLDRARSLIAASLNEGALGVSLGLGYCPEAFYDAEELSYILEPLKGTSLPLTVHMRGEGDTVCESIKEMLKVGEALGSPLHISHLKAIGRANWGRAIDRALTLMSEARQSGMNISYDVYPYTAGSTQLIHCLPPDMLEGGTGAVIKKLQERAERDRLTERLSHGTDFDNIVRLVGLENIVMSSLNCPENKCYEGRNIVQIAQLRNEEPFECLYDMLIEEQCRITMVDYITSEADIIKILKDSYSNVISDSTYPTTGIPHPRVYGTFSRIIEHFVRELGALSAEEAVRKMTSVPANVMNLRNKGVLTEGADADINVFALEDIHERATYDNPKQTSEGIEYCFVNGSPVIFKGKLTGEKPGRVIRGTQMRANLR